MALGPLPERKPAPAEIAERYGRVLTAIARDSIAHGLAARAPLAVEEAAYPESLRAPMASFVTLKNEDRLRGCIGKAQARKPLVVDVAENAFAAAFEDPRFPPLAEPEFDRLEIEVSVLGPPEPLAAGTEDALIAALRPGVDGLILKCGERQGLFLPAVWKTLPDPDAFVTQLKIKAGLAPDEWPAGIRAFRFETATARAPAARA